MADAWTMTDAMRLTRALAPRARACGYHVAIGGTLAGEEEADSLTLFLIPAKKNHDLKALRDELNAVWGPSDDLDVEPYNDVLYSPPRQVPNEPPAVWAQKRNDYDVKYIKDLYEGNPVKARFRYEKENGDVIEIWVL